MGFASAQSGWSFTLQSFSQLYCEVYGVKMDTAEFARRLWGDVYYHPDTRTFRKKPHKPEADRSFVQFILEPLYKIYSQVRHKALDSEVEMTSLELDRGPAWSLRMLLRQTFLWHFPLFLTAQV